jgi:pimeloyl-ACP methyl ester carboxylesterase
MKRIFHAFPLFFILLLLTRGQAAYSQSEKAQVSLLNRTDEAVTSIVDGNQVRLRLQLGTPENAETKITFSFPDLTNPIAECTVHAGEEACETSLFHALGWYWDLDGNATPERTITASASGTVIGSLNVSVSPRPVVMVHGFNASYKTWTAYLGQQGFLTELGLRGFAVGDGQVPGVMETGSILDPLKPTNTIAQNAVILAGYIDQVQEVTGAEKVDLLVHSMGGLISRYYIDRLMTKENVAQLILLGTPMAGSACAILPASLGMMIPATLELQPSYMRGIFNQQISQRKHVPFYALAGTKLLEEVESPCTPVPSDVVVTLDSVKAIPMPVEEMPLLHTELNSAREVFDGFVTPLLKTPPGEFEVPADPPPGANAPTSQQFSKVYTGHLNLGEAQDVVINIDPNVTVANFALFDTTRSLTISVIGASGRQLELDPVENGIIRIDDPSTMIYLGYGFKQPRPGRWVVKLQTSANTPASGADFAIAAQFNGGALLQTTQDITIPRVNETVTVTGTLTAGGAAVPLTSAGAIVRQPDGSVETLDMVINGNQAELKIAPRLSGIYGLQVNVVANPAAGDVIDRAAFLTFDAQPTTTETVRNQILAVALIAVLFIVMIVWARRRKSAKL